MTHSPLTNQIRLSSQNSSRNGTRVDTFLIHHQAGTNDDATINAMVNRTKQVSANYTISNEGRITLVVDEDLRAWTSGSTSDGGKGAQWDRRSITVEIENESAGGSWPISAAAYNAAAALLQDLKTRYGIAYVLGHRDLWNVYRASYATFCPGPSTVATIVALAGGGGINLPLPPTNVPSTPAGGDSTSYGYGLTRDAQLAVQQSLARLGRYSGDQDGIFGKQSVSAFQLWLKDNGYLAASYIVDGVPGPTYGKAIQTLAKKFGYTGPIDGAPGAATSTAIVAWARNTAPVAPQPAQPAGPSWSYWEPQGATAARVQAALKRRGRYTGAVDGVFGPNTRKGVQLTLKNAGFYNGPIDGIIGQQGSLGIQQYAKKFGSYSGPIDGAPREASWTGFALGLERP